MLYWSMSDRLGNEVEYAAWANMRHRCFSKKNPQYKDYGGRGISVCDDWKDSFANFLRDVGKRPGPNYTLDRIDNSKHYQIGNVEWRTRTEQALNRRSNHHITYNGITKTITEWSKETGIGRNTIKKRIYQLGWSIQRALGL